MQIPGPECAFGREGLPSGRPRLLLGTPPPASCFRFYFRVQSVNFDTVTQKHYLTIHRGVAPAWWQSQ